MGLWTPNDGTCFWEATKASSSAWSGKGEYINSPPWSGSIIGDVFVALKSLPLRILDILWGLEEDRVKGSTVAHLGRVEK